MFNATTALIPQKDFDRFAESVETLNRHLIKHEYDCKARLIAVGKTQGKHFIEVETLFHVSPLTHEGLTYLGTLTAESEIYRFEPFPNYEPVVGVFSTTCKTCAEHREILHVLGHEDGSFDFICLSCMEEEGRFFDFLTTGFNISKMTRYVYGSSYNSAIHRIYYRRDDVMRAAAQIVTVSGWISNSRASRQGITSTSELYYQAFRSRISEHEYKQTELSDEVFKDSVEWIKTLDDKGNDWRIKINEIGQRDIITSTELALTISAVGVYWDQRSTLLQTNNNFVGTIGERIELKVSNISSTISKYGFKMSAITEDGSRVVWYKHDCPRLPRGQVKLSGKVKTHSSGSFGKTETILNYVRY